jgi:hypothetical protein
MKTANIAANDIGNGNNKDMAMLMPKEIPIHTIWLIRNCLLLLLTLSQISLHITQLLK